MEACCIERLLHPQTKQPVAAIGWLIERKGLGKKFWVSIESHPIEYFYREDAAKLFYSHSIAPLILAFQRHKNGNGHAPIKRVVRKSV